MPYLYFPKKSLRHVLIILLMTFTLVTACRATSSETNTSSTMTSNTDMTDTNHHEHADMEASGDHDTAMRQFAPNNGAEVHITTPADEASFKSSDSVPVTIDTIDFTIGEDGNHWHIYLDGNPIMVMGGYTFVLQNLSAGQHDIKVYLSNGQHEDLEQGDSVTILVEE
jgi:hypothetical protein